MELKIGPHSILIFSGIEASGLLTLIDYSLENFGEFQKIGLLI
jgi:hypothetical protein